MTEIESLYQSLNAALDNFICKLPVFIQSNQQLKSKYISIKSAIDGILYGNGDQLWESFNQELDKRLEETKRINGRLRQYKNSSAAQQQDKINESDTIIPSATKNSANNLIKQKQQELNNLNMNYEKMKNSYTIQIQQELQEVDKYKRDIEIINMQINSILNRIMMLTRPINMSKSETDAIPKLNPFRANIRSNGSLLPQLNSSRQPIKNPRVAFSALPLSNNVESNEIRHPVSEPQMNTKSGAFHRGNRNLYSINNNASNKVISNNDSSDDIDSNVGNFESDNSYNITNENNNDINSSNSDIKTSIYNYKDASTNDNSSNNINGKNMIYNNDLSFVENNNSDNYVSSYNAKSAINVKSDSSSNSSAPDKKITKIYLRQNQEVEKTDQKVTEFRAALDEADDYMNEIDDIISDNFEDQNDSSDEN